MKIRALATSCLVALWACPGSLADRDSFVDGGAASNGDASVTTDSAFSSIDAPTSTALDSTAPIGPLQEVDDGGPCPDVESVLFPTKCGGCHGGGQMMGELDLTAPNVVTRLLGKPAYGDAGVLLIDPSTPSKSAVYWKLLASPPFGSRMPPAVALSNSKQACVLAWLESVVPKDAGADAPSDAPSDGGAD